ncbi:MAG: hypothetical protein AB7O52_12280 [Planctomycetota bacterium]
MSATSLAVWLLLLGPPEVPVGTVIPAGPHPAATLLGACASIDGLPITLESPELAHRSVLLFTPLAVHEGSLLPLEVLLRSAGLHRVRWVERSGRTISFVSTDPEARPPSELGYAVRRWRVRHVDVDQVAVLLNALVETREAERARELRTSFVVHTGTSTLIARYQTEEDLEPYAALLEQLDRPPAPDRASLRHWRPRHRLAALVAVELESEWDRRGGGSLRVVVHQPSNTLLITAAPGEWPDLERLLQDLDHE